MCVCVCVPLHVCLYACVHAYMYEHPIHPCNSSNTFRWIKRSPPFSMKLTSGIGSLPPSPSLSLQPRLFLVHASHLLDLSHVNPCTEPPLKNTHTHTISHAHASTAALVLRSSGCPG